MVPDPSPVIVAQRQYENARDGGFMRVPESRHETKSTRQADTEDTREVVVPAPPAQESNAVPEQHNKREDLEQALDESRRSEKRLRRIIDTIPALAWGNLPDGSNEFLNQRWHDYTGLSPQEAHGWGWQVTIHPKDLPRLMDAWRKLF